MKLYSLLFTAAASARVMDSLTAVPKDWKELRHASPDDHILLRIALKQQHAAALEQAVLEMSTPGHPNYGMHMTRDELRSFTAPSKEATSVVTAWLQRHAIEHSIDNDWISFTTTVDKANSLLNTSFEWYEYSGGGGPMLRTLSYTVPDEVAAHIDLVQPTTRFGQLGAKKSTIFDMHKIDEEEVATKAGFAVKGTAAEESAASCSPYITPACLRSLYNINYKPSASADNKVAFCSYLEEYARYSDLQRFEQTLVPEAVGQNFSVELVNGGLNDQKSSSDSGEANLDIQYILGTSYPIPIVEYSTGGRGPLVPTRDQPRPPGSNEPYFEFLTYILAQPDSHLPQTMSTSYGEEEQSVPQEYAVKVCNMFMQLGARGVSVLFSSGDSGPGNSCVRNTNNATFFEPTFPAGCPYVTSVGATTGQNPERAVGFSSGGFSIYHAQPSYQSAAVEPYLKSIGTTYAAYFNRSGRAIPDVAAQGVNFQVYDKGYSASLSGTSASSPVFAGIVALLNAARKSQGQPVLGFLNPWLYNNTDLFTDVTTGYGSGCTSNRELRSGARWNATAGWDPVTGLGTPKFDKMLAAAAPGVANA
ncbi:tripeptidyl-peptidase [Apodospora peruviana]|uniref:tripeptidyl-peptidase II n=1 Tax=Apodospora peruviana TaxID=516989 RepID=A0AAE0HSD3_9PEZI|nr:tripeptidyl-peptidase [Apodospora peruviana]